MMMHLGFSLTPFGHHPGAWRYAAKPEALRFDALLSQVSLAEDAGFAFVLLADRLGQRPVDDLSSVTVPFEPTTLVSALATKARKIGFLAAASTRQHEPYNLARRFASLDSISHGRTGWTIVGTSDEDQRDREYIELVSDLWDSWEDDSFIYDKANARFFLPEKMHVLNHHGANFTVRGPLNVNRSPQGKPILAHVLTEETRNLAACFAEVIFLQSHSAVEAEEAASDLVGRLEQYGRQRGDVRILANVLPYVGETRERAQAVHDALNEHGSDTTVQRLGGTVLIGTASETAEALQSWSDAGHIDGFTILPPTNSSFAVFVSKVVPLLRPNEQLGKQASGPTLRERLALERPIHPASKLEHAS